MTVNIEDLRKAAGCLEAAVNILRPKSAQHYEPLSEILEKKGITVSSAQIGLLFTASRTGQVDKLEFLDRVVPQILEAKEEVLKGARAYSPPQKGKTSKPPYQPNLPRGHVYRP